MALIVRGEKPNSNLLTHRQSPRMDWLDRVFAEVLVYLVPSREVQPAPRWYFQRAGWRLTLSLIHPIESAARRLVAPAPLRVGTQCSLGLGTGPGVAPSNLAGATCDRACRKSLNRPYGDPPERWVEQTLPRKPFEDPGGSAVSRPVPVPRVGDEGRTRTEDRCTWSWTASVSDDRRLEPWLRVGVISHVVAQRRGELRA